MTGESQDKLQYMQVDVSVQFKTRGESAGWEEREKRLQGRHDVLLAGEGAIGHFVAEIP
jgi:hypothetical protein